MKPTYAIFASALSLLVSACWTSDAPLMPDNVADTPGLSGTYLRYEGATATGDRYSVTRELDGYLVENAPRGGTATPAYFLTLDALVDDLYLAQVLDQNGDMEAYRLFQITDDGGELRDLDFDCGAAEAALPGVESDGTDCQFSNWDSLKKAATQRAVEFAGSNKGATLVARYERTND